VSEQDPTKPHASNDAQQTNVVPLTTATTPPTASERAIAFVKKHPVLTIAGGIAAGVAISALLPRKGGRKLARKAAGLAEAAGAAAVMFGRETSEKAHHLGHEARHKAEALASRAEKAGGAAAGNLEKVGLAALAAASSLGQRTARSAERISAGAVNTSHHLAEKAGELKQRVRH
jgi:hypothetical protein